MEAEMTRTITHFALEWDNESGGDDPVALTLTFHDGTSKTYNYPDDCIAEHEDDEGGLYEDSPTLLSADMQDCAAALTVGFPDDGNSEDWFRAWFLIDASLLDNRVAVAPPPTTEAIEEVSVDLSGGSADNDMTGAGEELAGDLSGDHASEVGETSEVKTAKKSRKKKQRVGKLREGAGCKQPDEVHGWEPGRLLCVTKNHRTHGAKPWGRCEYRVRCNADGSYKLEYFSGARKDLKQGDKWDTASTMFKVLLGLPPDTMHHKMTIRRYFNL